jgi:RNA polymerase sigma-70 factor, ECF subfamily
LLSSEAESTARFEAQRRLAFSIAYRMLGSKAEAEDIVQEAWLRWRESDPGAIESDRAWLTTVVTRLCLDHLKSARVRRETYPGPWLPEPLVGAEEGTPLDSESISMAFMLLLESLSPLERAVFLLGQVFEYSHAEMASIIGTSEAASRQALSRAKRHLQAKRPRFASSRESHERLLTAFVRAVVDGDLKALTSLFAADVTFIGDGGGKAKAARRPVVGRDAVARGTVGGARHLTADARLEYVDVNGWPGALLWRGDRVEGIISIECDDDQIHAIHVVVNPDKLQRVGPCGRPGSVSPRAWPLPEPSGRARQP